MNIIVMIKQVPGTSQVQVDPVTGVLKRDGVASKMNPYDLFAIEQALRLKEQFSGQVQVITMGPPQAQQVIEEAVYMGADRGCLLSDRQFAGADVLATAYTLSQGLRAMGEADLILCGKQTTDGDTAQVGPETAEFLGLPHVANVLEILTIDEETRQITLRVNLDARVAMISLSLPCLLTMEKDVNTPRLPSIKRRYQLGRADVTSLGLADLADTDGRHYGMDGSATQVERIFPPEKNDVRQLVEGDAERTAEATLQILGQRKFI